MGLRRDRHGGVEVPGDAPQLYSQALLREVKASGLVSRDLVMEDTENVVTMNTQPKSGEKIEVFFVVKGDYNGVRKAQTSINL